MLKTGKNLGIGFHQSCMTSVNVMSV